MKIDNDASTLFVKQDLFANGSAKKSSNATGKELDNALIADRNTIEINKWGDSYYVQLDPNSKHVSIGGMITQFGYIDDRSPGYQNLSITWTGDFDECALTPGDAVFGIETFVSASLKDTTPAGYDWDMKCLARELNSYMKFQPDSYDPEQDAYMKGLTERFDLLDPEHQDTRINQMRTLVQTVQGGNIIHVDNENFINQVKDSFDQPPAITIPDKETANTKKNKNFDQYKLNHQQILAYKISMTLAQNDASLMSKLLYKGNDKHFTTAAEAMKFSQGNESNTASTEMRDKKLRLENGAQSGDAAKVKDEQSDDVDNAQKNAPEEQGTPKSRVTATDWNTLSKDYTAENKSALSLIYDVYNK